MRERLHLSLALVLTLLGFLVVSAVHSAQVRRDAEAPRRDELVRLVQARQELVADLDTAVRALREEVALAQSRAADRSVSQQRAAEREAELAAQAGTVPLAGPGLVVVLDDSERKPPSPDQAGAYRIHDRDIQLVVNALFAVGAEAVAVNDSRVVATTPIRSAGQTILVNFRPRTPPYTIAAIGADPEEFETTTIAGRFRRWTRLFGLTFRVEEKGEILVPPHTGRVTISAAEPVEVD